MASSSVSELCKSNRSASRLLSAAPSGNGEASDELLELAYGAMSMRHQELMYGIDIHRGAGDISSLVTSALPKSRVQRTRRAHYWVEEDDLLGSLIRTKTEFSMLGFHLQVKAVQGNTDLDAEKMAVNQEQAEEISLKVGIKKIAEDMLRDWFETDSIIFHWKVDEKATFDQPDSIDSLPRNMQQAIPGLVYAGTIDPADVDWKNSLGTNRLLVCVPEEIKKRVEVLHRYSGQQRADRIAELINSGIPLKWINAVLNNENYSDDHGCPMVELKNEDGEYWIIRTTARKHYGLAKPSMYSIFLALETRRLFNDGDFAGAFVMKHFIQHVQGGESITTGPQAGSQKNWMKKADIDALMKQFVNTQKSQRIFTNHTITVKWLFPPPEMFDPAKYQNCKDRILSWAGVNQSIMGGGDDTTARAFIGIKRMIATMSTGRGHTSDIFLEFFRHPSIRPRCRIPSEYDVIAAYDENVLKDPKQLLDEVTMLTQEGMGDPATTMRELGRDPDAIKLSKVKSIEENKKHKIYEPVWNSRMAGAIPADGAEGGKQGGRPGNPGTESNEGTRLQRTQSSDA